MSQSQKNGIPVSIWTQVDPRLGLGEHVASGPYRVRIAGSQLEVHSPEQTPQTLRQTYRGTVEAGADGAVVDGQFEVPMTSGLAGFCLAILSAFYFMWSVVGVAMAVLTRQIDPSVLIGFVVAGGVLLVGWSAFTRAYRRAERERAAIVEWIAAAGRGHRDPA